MLVLRQLFGIATTAVTARLVAPADFGLLAIVGVFVQLLGLLDLGLKWSTVRAEDLDYQQVRTMFWWGGLLGLGLWGLSLLAGPILARVFESPRLAPVCAIVGGALFLNSLTSQPLALLKRQLRVRTISLIETAAAVGSGLAAITMALLGLGYWALVAQLVLVFVIRLAFAWIAASFRPGWPTLVDWRRAAALLRFGGWVGGSNWISWVQLYLDSILVGRFHGTEQLGFYNRAVYLKNMPSLYGVSALNDVLIPALAGLRGDRARFEDAYRRAVKLVSLVVFPAGALFGVAGQEIVLLLYGPKWTAVIPMLRWQATAAMLIPLFHTGTWLFISTGRGRAQFAVNCLLTPLVAAAFIAALPYGPLGMSVANGLVFTLLVPPLFLWFAHRAAGLEFAATLKALQPVFLATLAASVVGLAVGTLATRAGAGIAPRLAAVVLAGGCVYLWRIWVAEGRPTNPLAHVRGLAGRD